MTARPVSTYRNSFTALRGFARSRAPEERCEVCGVTLPAEHTHLLDPVRRQVMCACEACALSVGQREGSAFLRLPTEVCWLEEFNLSDGQWDDLLIPVGMAFFFFSGAAGKMMAYYPSPAGPTECLLSLQAWEAIVAENSSLAKLRPDVEALLVNRVNGTREYYLAPLDKCYQLVGLIRSKWRGLSGGTEVWAGIAAFFADLKAQSLRTQSEISPAAGGPGA